ncbi:mitochondrial-type heat shock 70 [Fusarium acuminatum]|uniref:Mitochondrial-type heat shock 70 n=1 Tax=Fusarium acuminatum TaxID=5515 RepID=A0ABZ2WI39_9HYPO
MTANEPVDDFIIIGIDFGTTYSGIAWAYSREPEEIELVTSWDSELNHCSDVEKAPTQLFYDNDKDTTWGYSVPADKDALKWFKLLLLDTADIPANMLSSSQLRKARNLLSGIKKDPVEVIACFLRKIWNHAIDSICRSVGVDLVQKSRFHVVITLPAIWPPYAQQRMKQAARVSGILDDRSCGETTLRFISEPEAAALATIKDLSKRSTIKDLISYVVESTAPFIVKECVQGGLCGGVFLDERFLELIKSKVAPGSWSSVSSSDEKKFLNDGWEHGIKPQFSNQNRTWLERWTAICRGAVVHGITSYGLSTTVGVRVGARIARRSYGVCFNTKFNPEIHDISDRFWANDQQEWLAKEQMKWFLKEGDNMMTKKPVRQDYFRLYSGHIGQVKMTIYSSSQLPPPKTWGPAVQTLCEIHWTQDVDIESLPTYTNTLGKVYHKLKYEVEMTCDDGIVDFTIYYQGKRVGAHNVDVQFR